MYSAATWKYVNKGLLVILGVFVLATIASLVFLSLKLLKLDSLISNSDSSAGTALELQALLINIDQAESGSRGYVITGDTQFLDPYNTALREIPKNLKAVQQNNKSELSVAQLKTLHSLTKEKMALMAQVVQARSTGDQDTFAATVASGHGRQLMDQIHRTVESVSSRSLADILPRQDNSRRQLQAALGVAALLALFVLGICGVLIWYFQYTIYRERALDSTKNEFLSLASHQLRTPATNVKQYLGMLMDGYLGELSSQQIDALAVAYKNNESEIRIMNDLLDVAKLDLKRIQIRKQRTDIVSVVKQVLRDYRQYLNAHDQTILLKAPDELMARVDRTYFKGVIEKLLDNAVKYSYDQSVIKVRVQADEVNNVFEVVIRDRGLGIGKREVPKLFMKFSRLTNEFSANTEGSGMGLYWVKQVMAMHNGTVKVVSREGRGSKFTVEAPIR